MTDEQSTGAPAAAATRTSAAAPAAKRRLGKGRVRALAWVAAAGAFALPWAAIRGLPASTTSAAGQAASGNQVVVVPAGSRVVITKPAGFQGKVTVLTAKGSAATSATAPVATTGGSAPPPI